jgi:hypothetical protein
MESIIVEEVNKLVRVLEGSTVNILIVVIPKKNMS